MKETQNKSEFKVYQADECCTFRKTKEQFGGLSNMASGFPLKVNGITFLSSEALYQACRYPSNSDAQRKIIAEKSPMTAKMVGKPFSSDCRVDWDLTRIKIMRWCLRIKLAQNYLAFGKILESTLHKPIVEESNKDDFWGAIRDKNDNNIMRGVNALGRLLMELRQIYFEKGLSYDIFVVEPLKIPNFLLFNEPIQRIDARLTFYEGLKSQLRLHEVAKPFVPEQPEVRDYPQTTLPLNIVKEPEPVEYKKNETDVVKKKPVSKKQKVKVDKYAGQWMLPF